MFSKLKEINDYYEQIQQQLNSDTVASDYLKYNELLKEKKRIEPIVQKYREYTDCQLDIDTAIALISDEDVNSEEKKILSDEIKETKERQASVLDELKVLLLPKDKYDDRNIIVEIRAGAGGEEAALFCSDLYRMYTMYAVSYGFTYDLLSFNETGIGGYKDISFMIKGEGAYSRFKFESGVHRVQRVPVTESQGRIQTSTVTVAVLPEIEDVEIVIRPEDIKFETCKSSGAGGQHINKTESAVRLIHIPSGIVIECQQERSQLLNKEKAMTMLRSKLYSIKKNEQDSSIANERRNQIGTGDRSEKIRTYNYPQGRVTDHRIGMTVYTLPSFMNGNIGEMIDALINYDTAEKLKSKEAEN